MPGRIIDGTGLFYLPTGGAPESESEVSKRNTARWSTRTVSTFTMMVRARSEFYSNDGLMLYSMLKENMIQEEGLVGKTADGETFFMKPDLILANHFTSVQTGEYIAQKYNIPLLFNSPQLVWDPMPAPPFYYPIHSAPRGLKEMNFRDRLFSVLWYKLDGHYWAHHFAYQLATSKLQQKCKCNMTITEYPEPGVIRPKLINTVVGFDYAIPTPPMVIYTGPLIYPPPGKEVPGDSPLEKNPELQNWLEKWDNGTVTVVSMGSHARLSETQGKALFEGLVSSGRPVLWSLRADNREFISKSFTETEHPRLRLELWLPQRAVLAHRTVQIFVGHCGFGGTHEAIYFGKPMVCIPVMADQPELAVRLRDSGAGVSLNVDKLTPEIVTDALNKLGGDIGEVNGEKKEVNGGGNGGGNGGEVNGEVNGEKGVNGYKKKESSYTRKAKELGKLMRLQGGVRRGAEVVEYLLETGSSDHWIMPDQNMPFVVRYNVDVYGIYVLTVFLVVLVVRVVAKGALYLVKGGGKGRKKKAE